MFFERHEDGVYLREMPMWVVDTLLSLPDWIESDNEDVRNRLLPKAYEDEAADKEWRDALGESLSHLFASRTAIVRGDLQKLEVGVPDAFEPTGDPDLDDQELTLQTLFSVFIPAEHLSAWVSTLQAGTHAVFILEGLTPEDLDEDLDEGLGLEGDPEKQISMMRLSILQEVLVRLLDDE